MLILVRMYRKFVFSEIQPLALVAKIGKLAIPPFVKYIGGGVPIGY